MKESNYSAGLRLKAMPWNLSICKLKPGQIPPLTMPSFLGVTDEEVSLVCETGKEPEELLEKDPGWRCMRIEGILDFSLIGILSAITGILAENKIGIFAISTYNTDYILTREAAFERALKVLEESGYAVLEG